MLFRNCKINSLLFSKIEILLLEMYSLKRTWKMETLKGWLNSITGENLKKKLTGAFKIYKSSNTSSLKVNTLSYLSINQKKLFKITASYI